MHLPPAALLSLIPALLAPVSCASPPLASDADPKPVVQPNPPAVDFELGVAYATGQGVAQNLGRAAGYYESACDAGHARACNNLGVLHDAGDGVPADPSRAAALFEIACNAGDTEGCFNLALAYDEGRGVPAAAPRAAALFEAACDKDHAEACYNIGVIHFSGRGVPADPNLGLSRFQRACHLGDDGACATLSKILDKACAAGSQKACDARAATTAPGSASKPKAP